MEIFFVKTEEYGDSPGPALRCSETLWLKGQHDIYGFGMITWMGLWQVVEVVGGNWMNLGSSRGTTLGDNRNETVTVKKFMSILLIC